MSFEMYSLKNSAYNKAHPDLSLFDAPVILMNMCFNSLTEPHKLNRIWFIDSKSFNQFPRGIAGPCACSLLRLLWYHYWWTKMSAINFLQKVSRLRSHCKTCLPRTYTFQVAVRSVIIKCVDNKYIYYFCLLHSRHHSHRHRSVNCHSSCRVANTQNINAISTNRKVILVHNKFPENRTTLSK